MCDRHSLLQGLSQKSGHTFQEGAIVAVEGGGRVAVNVDLAQYSSFVGDRHHNLGTRLQAAGEVTRISIHVADHDGLPAGGGGAENALIERNASVRRGLPTKGPSTSSLP